MGNEQSTLQEATAAIPADQSSQGRLENLTHHSSPADNLLSQPISPPQVKRKSELLRDHRPPRRHQVTQSSRGDNPAQEVQNTRSVSPANVRHRFVRDEPVGRVLLDGSPNNAHGLFSAQSPRSPVSVCRPTQIVDHDPSLDTPRSPEDSPRSPMSTRAADGRVLPISAPVVNYRGVRNVPTGPRAQVSRLYDSTEDQNLTLLDMALRMPHIFIDYIDVPRSVHTPKHMDGLMRGHRPDNIMMGDRGYYLVFEGSHAGRERLADCFRHYDGQLLFKEYTLHMQCYKHGQGEDLQRQSIKHRSVGSAHDYDAIGTPSRTEKSSSGSTMMHSKPTSPDRNAARNIEKSSAAQVEPNFLAKTAAESGGSHGSVFASGISANAPHLYQNPNARLLGRLDRDDASSSVSGATDTSRSKRSKCHICKQEVGTGVPGLVRCSACPRKYHRRCHKDPSIPPDLRHDHDWMCSRCTTKGTKRISQSRNSERTTAQHNVSGLEIPGDQDLQLPATYGQSVNISGDREDMTTKPASPAPMDSLQLPTSPLEADHATTTKDREPDRVPSEVDADEVVQQSFAQSMHKPGIQEAVPKPGKLKFTRKKIIRPASIAEPTLEHVIPGSRVSSPQIPASSIETHAQSPATSALDYLTSLALNEISVLKPSVSLTPSAKAGMPKNIMDSEDLDAAPIVPDQQQKIDARGKGDEDCASMSLDAPAESALPLVASEAASIKQSLAVKSLGQSPSASITVKPKPTQCDTSRSSIKPPRPGHDATVNLKDPRLVAKKLVSSRKGSRRRIESSPSAERSDSSADPIMSDRPKTGPRKGPTGLGTTLCGKCKTRRIMRDPSGTNTLCTYCKQESMAAKPSAIKDSAAASTPNEQHGIFRPKQAATAPLPDSQTSAIAQTLDGALSPAPMPKSTNDPDQPEETSQRRARLDRPEQKAAKSDGQKSKERQDAVRNANSPDDRRHAKDPPRLGAKIAESQPLDRGKPDAFARHPLSGFALKHDGDHESANPKAGTANASQGVVEKKRRSELDTESSVRQERKSQNPRNGNISTPVTFTVEEEANIRNRLGDSFDRPKGTRAELVGMAMCAAPNYRIQAQIAMEWIAANIPTYKLGEGKWEDSLKAQLSQGRDGAVNGTRKVRWQTTSWQEGDAGDPKYLSYQLLPGAAELMWQWDAVLKEPSPPQRRELAPPKTLGRDKLSSKQSLASSRKSNAERTTVVDPDVPKLSRKSTNGSARPAPNEPAESGRRPSSQSMSSADDALVDTGNAMDIDTPMANKDPPQQVSASQETRKDEAAADVAQQSSDDEPIARKRHKAMQDLLRPTPAPVAMMQPTPSVTEAGDQSDGQQRMPDTSFASNATDVRDAIGKHSLNMRSPRKPTLRSLPLRESLGSFAFFALQEAVRIDTSAKDYTALSLFKEWPEYDPRRTFDKAAKMEEIRKRPTRKQMIGKPASRSRLHQPQIPSPYSSFESPTKKHTSSPEKLSRAIVDARPGDPYPWENPDADFSHQEFETLNGFFGLPDNPIPILSEGQLAFRDGTRNEDGRLPRAKAVYKTGYAA